MEQMNKIKLGVKARDKITGFEGIVTGSVEYLYGCDQWGLTPVVTKEGKTPATEIFDEGRVEYVSKGVLPKEVKVAKNGGPNRDAPKA